MSINPDLVTYYARRAAEYERVYQKPERQQDLRELHASIAEHFRGQVVLEISCGTGYWTASIAATAKTVVACDINESVLEIARQKTWPPNTTDFRHGNAYALPEFGQMFTAAFAGFWWSHMPRARRPAFLAGLNERLQVGSRVMFIDNRYIEGSSTPIARTDAEGNGYQHRQLADGSRHEVLKNFPTSEELLATVDPFAASATVRELEYFWILTYRTRWRVPE